MSKIAALEEKMKQIQEQLQKARREAAGPMIERMKAQMKTHGITAADLTEKAAGLQTAAKGVGQSVAAKAQALKATADMKIAGAKTSLPAKAAKVKATVTEKLAPAKAAVAKVATPKVAKKPGAKKAAKKAPAKAAAPKVETPAA